MSIPMEQNNDRHTAQHRYLLFPGCLASIRFPRLVYLARRLFPELGIKITETESFSCCPDPVRLRGADRLTSLAIAARNLAVAGETGLPVITLCPSCTLTLAGAGMELESDHGLLRKVNDVLAECGRELSRIPPVTHFLKVLYESPGPAGLREMVRRPLKGIALSYHSGCHENSPPDILRFDNPFNPRRNEELLEALGARVVDYKEKSACCGSPLSLDGKMDDSLSAVARKVEDMRRCGAEALVVGCASCFQQFEIGQVMARRKGLLDAEISVFHFIEVLALAMGYGSEAIDVSAHKVKGAGTAARLLRGEVS